MPLKQSPPPHEWLHAPQLLGSISPATQMPEQQRSDWQSVLTRHESPAEHGEQTEPPQSMAVSCPSFL
jgi:hypothetical protein